jgi:hypothetical protein
LDIHVYWNILTMHGPINVKSPNNTSKWQMGFNSAFKGLRNTIHAVKVNVILLNKRQYLFPTKCQTTQMTITMVFSLLVPPEECQVNRSGFVSCHFHIQNISTDVEGSL